MQVHHFVERLQKNKLKKDLHRTIQRTNFVLRIQNNKSIFKHQYERKDDTNVCKTGRNRKYNNRSL